MFKFSKFLNNKYHPKKSNKKKNVCFLLTTMNSFVHAFNYPPLDIVSL